MERPKSWQMKNPPKREQEQIMKLPPTRSHEKHNAFFEILLNFFFQKSRVFGLGLPDLEPLVDVWLDPPVDGCCQRAYTTKAGKKKKENTLQRA
jgi:hypothetical protein